MRFAGLDLEFPVLLAPLCGITDSAFRRLCREKGAAVVYSEMVVADGVVRANETTRRLMHFTESERPFGIQLCGSDPGVIAEAARRVTALAPDLIDINLGCPVRKVVDRKAGSALLQEPARMEEVVSAVVQATHLPVTVKMRIGWDEKSVPPAETARRLEACGVRALSLHARTRAQGFSGKADWSHVADVKRAVNIPVVGNGDVLEPGEVRRMLEETGCDAVMVGRGSMGNPWIFDRTVRYLRDGDDVPTPPVGERVHTALRHLDYMIEDKGEEVAVREIRKHLPGYLKGERDAREVRNELHQAPHALGMREILMAYLERLEQTWPAPEATATPAVV